MNHPRALIAEDEPILAYTLQQTLQRLWPELQVCGVVDNGASAVQEALAQRPDVLFLDIKMPGKTGLEAAQELAEDWPEGPHFPLVVFVTAYDEYALQAFEYAAADYVLKPISDGRLGKTVERLKPRLQHDVERGAELERIVGQLRSLVPGMPGVAGAGERLTMIRAAVGNQIRLIPVDEVQYFEATDKYVNVVTAESESLIRTSLKELLPQLDPSRFWQIHRGTVVNVHCIQAALRDETGKLLLKLKNREQMLTVSRVYAHLFKQM
ncbi:LytR/AlgR family response regulator transcription factor [Noviherbaspirillum sp. Root189]|uniref:LytR/AlgR family response regulator transcription factor n=1 Tax=Noviherbaspirillum sp. Root189 TaxID=1736487 RepID=UPI00070CA4E4|nr:LytTR family DNA-binding domain-containing protein [Noviherbaspirillum sp. Root189]KRB73594.1 LytR family transcriptional regulator [Noviherbaspirillum sp. Root189]